jgi:prevent-host-death family protein
MSIKTFTSRELNHDVSRAKKAAEDGPVVITDRGKPSHVLMTYEDFQRLTGTHRNLVEALAMPGLSDIEFDPLRAGIAPRGIDLS